MPMLPIDLQTMFSHMNQIGKDQAAQKEVGIQHQALQGMEMAEKTVEKDNSVPETPETGDGPEKVQDKEKKESRKRKADHRKEQEDENDEERKVKKVVFEDPDLGHHIDITG